MMCYLLKNLYPQTHLTKMNDKNEIENNHISHKTVYWIMCLLKDYKAKNLPNHVQYCAYTTT